MTMAFNALMHKTKANAKKRKNKNQKLHKIKRQWLTYS